MLFENLRTNLMRLGLFLFFIFVLAANVVIGYAIAVLWGIGPPNFRTARIKITRSMRIPKFSCFFHGFQTTRWKSVLDRLTLFFASLVDRMKLIRHLSPRPFPVLTKSFFEKSSEAEEHQNAKLQEIAARDVRDFLEDESESVTHITPTQELFHDNRPNIISNQGTEIWMANDKHIEESVYKLNIMMMENGLFSGELDEKLRSMPNDSPLEEVRRVCQNLADDCRNYLENQSIITDEIHNRANEFEELTELAEAIDQSNREQVSQIQSILDHLDQHTKLENVANTIQNLLQYLTKLRKARHSTRDIHDRAFVALARVENRLGSINREEVFIDQSTKLDNRIAFQTHLWEWWQQERQKKTKLTFVLYDIVGFTEWNSRIGIRTCDKLLTALAHEIGNHIEGKIFLGMYSGSSLVSVSSDIGLIQTGAFVEMIRREIEYTKFTWNDSHRDVSVQLTCAVTEATDQQSEADVIDVLDQTLAAAKNSGRNLTWLYDPVKQAPERVEWPEQTVTNKVVDLDAKPLLDIAKPE